VQHLLFNHVACSFGIFLAETVVYNWLQRGQLEPENYCMLTDETGFAYLRHPEKVKILRFKFDMVVIYRLNIPEES